MPIIYKDIRYSMFNKERPFLTSPSSVVEVFDYAMISLIV